MGTTRVGFGIARGHTGAYFVVAHYSPLGNVVMTDYTSGTIGILTNMLPLPFRQEHIDEAKALSASHAKTVAGGIVYSVGNLTSEETALDFDTINT